MVKLSAKTTVLITTDILNVKSTTTTTTYRVGNCTLSDTDIETLFNLGRISKENPVTVDQRAKDRHSGLQHRNPLIGGAI